MAQQQVETAHGRVVVRISRGLGFKNYTYQPKAQSYRGAIYSYICTKRTSPRPSPVKRLEHNKIESNKNACLATFRTHKVDWEKIRVDPDRSLSGYVCSCVFKRIYTYLPSFTCVHHEADNKYWSMGLCESARGTLCL